MENNHIDWKKYLIVFLFTAGIFLSAGYVSNYFSNNKLEQLKTIQDKIAIDILSSETQYSLLSELSCKNISESLLSGELAELGHKLEWSEDNLGDTETVSYLKKYYSLLQIKDYLLNKKISERCGTKLAFVLYFYTIDKSCTECIKQGYVLTTLREKYPEMRVYSFDHSVDLSAVKSILDIYKIEETKLPALVVGDDVLTGFQELDALEDLIVKSFGLEKKVEIEEKTEEE